MRILIDADACPVTRTAIDIAKKYNIPVMVFFDASHVFFDDYAIINICDKGKDSVDMVILKSLEKNDIVITQDYGLASLVLAKSGYALNQNGLIYTDLNIDSLLDSRYFNAKLRNATGRCKGPKKRKDLDNLNFMKSFEMLIIEVLKKMSKSD